MDGPKPNKVDGRRNQSERLPKVRWWLKRMKVDGPNRLKMDGANKYWGEFSMKIRVTYN